MSSQTFADLGVSSAATGALARRGITEPFAVQKLVIPDALAGHDVTTDPGAVRLRIIATSSAPLMLPPNKESILPK